MININIKKSYLAIIYKLKFSKAYWWNGEISLVLVIENLLNRSNQIIATISKYWLDSNSNTAR